MQLEKRVPGLGCPLDHAYSEEEWRAFVQCARDGMESGERLHNDFDVEIERHELSPREVEKALNVGAGLAAYERNGSMRLALWDPRSELIVIATVPDGLVLTAYAVGADRVHRYVGSFDSSKWLKRP